MAERFLHPSLEHLHDPMLLADMGKAVERIERALAAKERVAIHGDYDVDGITSTVILRRALEMLGGEVVHFIPERLTDGYGLQPAAIDRLHGEGVRLIISVDCGIRGTDAALRARELGIDLIITDHHEPDGTLPPAFAVINPKRARLHVSRQEPRRRRGRAESRAGAVRRAGKTSWLPAFVKIAAIGTLADVVPLVGENRVIAKLGLGSLSTARHTVGLRALLEASGLTGKTIDSYHVGFILAPRVNAAGRMSTPDIATRLLLATDEAALDEARGLAQQLNEENLRRQTEEADLVAQAKKAIETDPSIGAHNVLVVGGEGWHRGVIGIAASKLVDAYHKPAIVLSVDGGVAHGSCRSIPAFDMLAALERCADLFLRFGGHKQAAGLTMDAAKVPEFRARDQRARQRRARARSAAAALAYRRRAQPQAHHPGSGRRPERHGAVRPGQSPADLPRDAGGDRRRAAADQGTPPEDDLPAGRPQFPRHRLARRRARRVPHRAPRRRQPRVFARAERIPGRDVPGAECRRLQESGDVE